MPSPGLGTLYLADHLTRWVRRWAPTVLLLVGAALEVLALLLPGVWLGWVGAAVLLLPLLAGRPAHQDAPTADHEASEIRPPGVV